MKKRALSATLFVVAMLAGVFGGAQAFYILFGGILAGTLLEFGNLVYGREGNHLVFRKTCLVVIGMLPFLIYGSKVFGLFLPLSPGAVFSPYLFEATLADHASPILISLMACLLGIFLLMFVELFMGSDAPFSNIGHVLLGLMYLGLPFSLLVSIAFWHGDYAPMRVFGLLLLNWTNDTMAYVVGSKIGKTPFFTRISPNKTWEGTLGGVFFTFVVATIFALWLPSFQPAEWLTMAAMVGIFGTAGDLIESMLKRSIRVKDSGSFLPGHGGFLDRFDSFVFALPFVWFALMLLEG